MERGLTVRKSQEIQEINPFKLFFEFNKKLLCSFQFESFLIGLKFDQKKSHENLGRKNENILDSNLDKMTKSCFTVLTK